MNNFVKLLLGAGALTGIYFIATANKIKALIIKPGEISKFKFRLAKPSSIFFTLYVTNPNSKSLIFNEFYGTLKFNGKIISTVNKKQEITIPGKGATTSLADIEALVSALDVIDEFLNEGNKTILLEGTLTANGLSFPVSSTIQIKAL